MKVVIKTQKDLIEELKKAIADRDNKVVHSIYDFIILNRLKELDPKLVKKLDKLAGEKVTIIKKRMKDLPTMKRDMFLFWALVVSGIIWIILVSINVFWL